MFGRKLMSFAQEVLSLRHWWDIRMEVFQKQSEKIWGGDKVLGGTSICMGKIIQDECVGPGNPTFKGLAEMREALEEMASLTV